jgi:hypothetical protein
MQVIHTTVYRFCKAFVPRRPDAYFSLHDSVYSIYDWIGSLPDSPEHFQLCTYSGDCVSPNESVNSVDKCMLVMVPSIDPVIPEPTARVLIPPGYLHPGKRKH